ncbi:bifunctional 4-hydroxy-2-oxoglutarate aldolase/2-dehydro-3-deoxy-phosphogluconate aldolase [Leifsonia sp. 22587]|uniref:bifunctional 4-hydroxy-2-oxoglutarate aldolase/2-dehydro-3-deoxy-phosphogluconate aldolase n=1 Tax=Leifsonia sp. 22587 TaxID=3453946 RepID=UPI003F8385F2
MSNRDDIRSAIVRDGVVAIVRATDSESALQAATGLLRGGLRAVEISLTTPGALEAITAARRLELGYVGAGTVLDESSATAAIRAGAQFLVAPTLKRAVIRTGLRHGAVTLPGVATPTEAVQAMEYGADFAKLFPASGYGPKAIADMLAALKQVPFVPTGGVTLEDAADYIRAGSVAVGLGSALCRGSQAEMSTRIHGLLSRISAAR